MQSRYITPAITVFDEQGRLILTEIFACTILLKTAYRDLSSWAVPASFSRWI